LGIFCSLIFMAADHESVETDCPFEIIFEKSAF